jgi:hypothetical protein
VIQHYLTAQRADIPSKTAFSTPNTVQKIKYL